MEDRGHVEYPARQELGGYRRGPEHHAAGDDEGDERYRRPVVELLPVGPAVEQRPRPRAEEPPEHRQQIPQILPARNQRVGPEPVEGLSIADDVAHEIEQLPKEYDREKHCERPMDNGLDLRSTQPMHDDRRPGG